MFNFNVPSIYVHRDHKADVLGQGAQDGHLTEFHTAPELCRTMKMQSNFISPVSTLASQKSRLCRLTLSTPIEVKVQHFVLVLLRLAHTVLRGMSPIDHD